MRVLCVGIFAIGFAVEARSQAVDSLKVELKSVQLSVLSGAERERFLAAHNGARREVGVEAVEWSDELGKVALESLEKQKQDLIKAAKEGWAKERAVLPRHRGQRS